MKKVLLIDSGMGGLNILKECIKICPCCDYLYFCDNKNLPYGNKSKDELIDITIKNLATIQQFFNFDIVVLACNTLTSTCIDECRKRFADIKFVGTEPAVKPALKLYDPHDILVLATQSTIKNNKLLQRQPFQLMAMPNLASQIDENVDNLQVLVPELKETLKNVSAKAVVLGCTHYASIKDLLISILPPKTAIFDSSDGVARRLKQLVGEASNGFKVQIMTSNKTAMREKLLWVYFNN